MNYKTLRNNYIFLYDVWAYMGLQINEKKQCH